MCGDNRNDCGCISEILRKILLLQHRECCDDDFVGCDRPFLGPSPVSLTYNTRPVQLYNCCTGTPWSFEYTLADGTTGTSDTFRVESVDDCCCTCRLLYTNGGPTGLSSTGNYVTIDLNCCGAIRCLDDTFIETI